MSSISDDLWPDDVKSQEFLTPDEILTKQAGHLTERTGGLIAGNVVREEVKSESEETKVVLRFEIASARVDKRIKLFEAAHRDGFEYPVSLTPPSDELPNYLKEKYYQPGMSEIMSIITQNQFDLLKQKGCWIENDWVASSPIAFANKVQSILSMPSVKSAVMSLLAKSKEIGGPKAENS